MQQLIVNHPHASKNSNSSVIKQAINVKERFGAYLIWRESIQ